MAPITVDVLITTLCDKMGWNSADSTQRAAALKLLQDSENWIAQRGSWLYLERETTLVVSAAASTAAIPSWVDFGKAMTLGLPDGNGLVQIVPSDRFRRTKAFTYGSWNTTFGRIAKISFDTTGTTRYFFFDQAAVGQQTYPFSAQQLPNTLADNSGSTSSLPEGYERSLLLKRAEFEGKREIRAIVTDQEREDLKVQMDQFFDQQRSTRERSMPDSEVAARKQSAMFEEGGVAALGQ